MLGLIALVSLILGILFAVGVIGNKGVNVDPNVNSQGVPKNSHFRMTHFDDEPLEGWLWNRDGATHASIDAEVPTKSSFRAPEESEGFVPYHN